MSHSSSTTGSIMAELASLLAAGLFLLGMGGSMLKNAATQTRIYTPDESAFPNAQIGYAPMTDSAYAQDSLLRYVELRWREVEPQEGVYAWDALDAQYGFRDLRARGIHLVIRFVCDVPGQESHMDIPDWLYAQTGDGSWYSTDYGKGYSPDYSNATFRAAHRRVLAALGEHFGTDGFVTYVELGSLGHWGEWHIKTGEGLVPMPGEAIRDEYVADYEAAFPTAKLLMRRPFNITAAHGLGVYNDMTGHGKDTAEWLGWLQNGGWYGEEPNALAPMPAFWQSAPVGGEFTSSIPMKTMLRSQLSQTVELVQQSHMSFLGPKVAEETYRGGYNAVLKNLGYRLRVTQLTLTPGPGGTTVTLAMRNDGNAPFYWDWSTNLYLEDAAGNPLAHPPAGSEPAGASARAGADGLRHAGGGAALPLREKRRPEAHPRHCGPHDRPRRRPLRHENQNPQRPGRCSFDFPSAICYNKRHYNTPQGGTTMDAKRICPYCMQELDAPEPVCPHCGRSLTGRNPSGSLPVGTVLAGRYTVGEIQSIDGEDAADCP